MTFKAIEPGAMFMPTSSSVLHGGNILPAGADGNEQHSIEERLCELKREALEKGEEDKKKAMALGRRVGFR